MIAESRGMTLSQFRQLPISDQVEAIALKNTLSKMAEWESYQAELEAEKNKRKR